MSYFFAWDILMKQKALPAGYVLWRMGEILHGGRRRREFYTRLFSYRSIHLYDK